MRLKIKFSTSRSTRATIAKCEKVGIGIGIGDVADKNSLNLSVEEISAKENTLSVFLKGAGAPLSLPLNDVVSFEIY